MSTKNLPIMNMVSQQISLFYIYMVYSYTIKVKERLILKYAFKTV